MVFHRQFHFPCCYPIPVFGTNLSAESGFLVFKFHEVHLSRSNVQVEVLMDDYMFPAYTSPKIRSKSAKVEDSM